MTRSNFFCFLWIVGLLLLSNFSAAFSAFPAHHSFTSGNPPLGDGEDYPRHLNPARQATGGASPGTFFATTGVSFNNLNGNPAYFDSNNLLTRPATLINNEAFWTDPKIGSFSGGSGTTFELAQFGFDFLDGFSSGADFGFDLAVASVSSDLPERGFYDENSGNYITAPYLPFQIQDNSQLTARGALVFAEGESISYGESYNVIFADSVGTFPTLNSPRTAYEARFRVDEQFLREMIEYDNEFFEEEPGNEEEPGGVVSGPIQFFDIDLIDIATFGGTTQVAMDNFVLAGAPVVNDSLREPLTVSPHDPVGANMPQYFSTDDSSNPFEGEISEEDLNLILGLIPDVGGLEIFNPISAPPLSDGSQTTHTTITVPGDSGLFEAGAEGPLGGVSVLYEEPSPSDPSPPLLPEETTVGGVIEIGTVTSNAVEKTGTLVVETANRTSGLLGNIAQNLSDSYLSDLGEALNDVGVNLAELGQDSPIPLSGSELNQILSGLLGGGSSESGLGEIIDDANSSSGIGGLMSKIAKNVPGIENSLANITQDIMGPLQESLLMGDSTNAGILSGLFSEIGKSLSNSIGSTVTEQLEAQDQQIVNSVNNLSSQVRDAAGKATTSIRMIETMGSSPLPLQSQPFESLVAAIIEETEPQIYVNYTYDEYLALLESLGEMPVIGDTGGYIEAIYDAAGQVIDFQFNSWIVTDGSGSYLASVAMFSGSSVPEPSSAVLLLLAMGAMGSRRRNAR